jgi:hypothetical protein
MYQYFVIGRNKSYLSKATPNIKLSTLDILFSLWLNPSGKTTTIGLTTFDAASPCLEAILVYYQISSYLRHGMLLREKDQHKKS